MAKLLFAVDHRFQRSAGGDIYTIGGKFPYAKWEEYLAHFDEVIVVSRGVDVTDGETANLALSSGPKVHHHLVDDRRGWRRLTTLRAHRALLERLVADADAVIGRLPSELGLTACALAANVGKPYLVELVTCPWDALWNHGALAAKAYAPVMTMRTRRRVRAASLVHYVTRAFLQRRYPTAGKSICASNVMLPESGADVRAARLDRIDAITQGGPVTFGTTGSMTTRLKGIHIAIAALATGRDQLPDFNYRIPGEGDPAALGEQAVRLGIGDRVHFDGTLAGGGEVARWLDAIDIYLQPSFQEGLPRALIEALNRGCLAIGSTAGGIPELLPPDRMHRPGDAAGLIAGIEALLSQPRAAMAQEADRNAVTADHYSYPRSLAAKNEIYRALRAQCGER